MVAKSTLNFLEKLKSNNSRDWFAEHKNSFLIEEKAIKSFFNKVYAELQKIDSVEKMQIFRIYRNVRFSKDKSPYKNHFSVGFTRTKPALRGGMYLHIEPQGSFIGGGFWEPNATDLYRIRKEFETDDSEIRAIISSQEFQNRFGQLEGEELKTAPKGFDKNHQAIDLIRKKQFLVTRKFSDQEIMAKDFMVEVINTFKDMQPFFNYMSDVLSTDLNGESLI